MFGSVVGDLVDDPALVALRHQFVEPALVVGCAAGVEVGRHEPFDQVLRPDETAIEVDGPDHRLHGVGQYRLAVAAAGGRLALAQQQHRADAQVGRHLGEGRRAHHRRPDARELPFVGVGDAGVDAVGHDEAEDRVAEELEALVALEPGVLGNQRQFKSYYQKPIEQEGSGERLQRLLTRIAPLMLRRTKNQVASDLPPKTVVQQIIPLSEEQQAFYQRVKQDDWQNLMQQLEGMENPGQKQMLLLAALIRLRQACCDPRLLGEDAIASAKTDYCLDMLESLVAEGRAVLVFSQFTQMIALIECGLNQRDIVTSKLTGQTRKRQEAIAAFQDGPASVFLISLKAGGAGLNLTAADTVVHVDPWWNPAVENQATDRAYRIGQDKPVFVYKLVASGTVEEKIQAMQREKQALADAIFDQTGKVGLPDTGEELLALLGS